MMNLALAFGAGAVAVYLYMQSQTAQSMAAIGYGGTEAGYGGYGASGASAKSGPGPYGFEDIEGYGTKNIPTPSRYQLMTLKNFMNIKSCDEEWEWNRVPGSNIIMKPAQLLNPEAPLRVSGTDGPTPVPYYLLPWNAVPDGTPQNFDPSALGAVQNLQGLSIPTIG